MDCLYQPVVLKVYWMNHEMNCPFTFFSPTNKKWQRILVKLKYFSLSKLFFSSKIIFNLLSIFCLGIYLFRIKYYQNIVSVVNLSEVIFALKGH